MLKLNNPKIYPIKIKGKINVIPSANNNLFKKNSKLLRKLFISFTIFNKNQYIFNGFWIKRNDQISGNFES